MIGDDTWLDLFPTHFARATPFPSLVVKDIHTVRPGVHRLYQSSVIFLLCGISFHLLCQSRGHKQL